MDKSLMAAWEQEQSARHRGWGRERLSSMLQCVAPDDVIDARLLRDAGGEETLSVESRHRGERREYPVNHYDTEFRVNWALNDAANWLLSD